MQTQQVSEVVKAAGKGSCCVGIAMQCYQQLHTMLGDVDTGTVTETSAMLTMDQAATTAATLKGQSWHPKYVACSSAHEVTQQHATWMLSCICTTQQAMLIACL